MSSLTTMAALSAACFALFSLTGVAAADQATDDFYTAIRTNDLSGLAKLVETSGANVADDRGITPLISGGAAGLAIVQLPFLG